MAKILMSLLMAFLLVTQPAEAGVVRGIKRFARAAVTLPAALIGGAYVGYIVWKIGLAVERASDEKSAH